MISLKPHRVLQVGVAGVEMNDFPTICGRDSLPSQVQWMPKQCFLFPSTCPCERGQLPIMTFPCLSFSSDLGVSTCWNQLQGPVTKQSLNSSTGDVGSWPQDGMGDWPHLEAAGKQVL